MGSEPLWARMNSPSGLLTQTWKDLCPELSSQTRKISTRSDQNRVHGFKDQERGPAMQSPLRSTAALLCGLATRQPGPEKGASSLLKVLMQCHRSSIQGHLHLAKRTRAFRGLPNVLPHLELRTSLLEAKKVDPHLTVAVKGNELG